MNNARPKKIKKEKQRRSRSKSKESLEQITLTNLHGILNERNEEVGQFDSDSMTYRTTRDAQKGQIFIIPSRYGDVSISVSILKQLARNNCQWIEMLILNFEKQPFRIRINFNEFLEKSEIINFDKKTKDLNFHTYYGNQKKLNIREFERIPDKAQRLLC